MLAVKRHEMIHYTFLPKNVQFLLLSLKLQTETLAILCNFYGKPSLLLHLFWQQETLKWRVCGMPSVMKEKQKNKAKIGKKKQKTLFPKKKNKNAHFTSHANFQAINSQPQ